jgi:hypothetical protein
MIHFKHQRSELANKGKKILQALDREIKRLERTKSEFVTTSVQERRQHAAEAIEEILQKVDEEMAFMGQRASSGPAREKRFLAAVIAAASAIFSFGLGISTEVELKNLRDTTNGIAKNQRFIVAQLVELARETDKELDLAVEQIHWAFVHSNLNQKLIRCVDHLREDARRWTQGLYHLMAGQLDPAIVSVPDLRRGLLQLEEEARNVGMKVAPMENRIEILFSAPVTTYFEDDVINVWVSVPLIPEETPVFELLHLEHQPIQMDQYLVELDAGDGYLAVDHLRRVHALMTATELAACDQHRNHYFCRRQTFSTETDNCPIALLRGDKPAAAKLCKKYFSKAPLVAATLHTEEPRRTLITVAKPTAVQRLCPHGSSQPVQWVHNATELVVPAGCYLQAGGTVTFLAHAPPEVVVASEGDHWRPEEIFGEELPSVKERLSRLNVTKERMILPEPHPESSGLPVWFWPSIGALILLLSAVLLDLAARYGCLIKKRLRAKQAEPTYEAVLVERQARRSRPAPLRRLPRPPSPAPRGYDVPHGNLGGRQQMAPLVEE